jgi:hypothetical protein
MKIVDCFPYFNEKYLLDFRLKLYNNVVDEFIITEADRTFTGNKKPFVCKQILQELGYQELLANGRIRVVEVIMPEHKLGMMNPVREHLQRDQAGPLIPKDSVAFITDIDEIIDPEYIPYYVKQAQLRPDNILHIPMDWLHGRADLLMCNPDGTRRVWQAGYVCLQSHIEEFTLSKLREHVTNPKPEHNKKYEPVVMNEDTVNPKGWHFNWIGDNNSFTTKWVNCTHYNDIIHWSPYGQDNNAMTEFMTTYQPEQGSTDVLGRENHILQPYDINRLPTLLFEDSDLRHNLFPDLEV